VEKTVGVSLRVDLDRVLKGEAVSRHREMQARLADGTCGRLGLPKIRKWSSLATTPHHRRETPGWHMRLWGRPARYSIRMTQTSPWILAEIDEGVVNREGPATEEMFLMREGRAGGRDLVSDLGLARLLRASHTEAVV